VTQATLDTALAEQTTQIDNIRQLVAGGGFTTDVHKFDSRSDTLVWAKKFLPGTPMYGCFSDVLIVLAAIRNTVSYAEDMERSEVHMTRVKRHPAESRVVQSFMTTIPELYAGPKTGVDATSTKFFGAFKEYSKWDAGMITSTGLYNRIASNLPSTQQGLEATIRTRLIGYPEAIQLCTQLLSLSVTFVNTKATFMATFYRELKISAFGTENPGAPAEKLCWKIVTLCIRTLFVELRKVRVEAEAAHTSEDNANGLYLWGVLQAHRVMKDFADKNFSMHPAFYPQLMMFLFENGTPRQDFDELKRMVKELKGLPGLLEKLSQRLDNALSRIDSLEKRPRK